MIKEQSPQVLSAQSLKQHLRDVHQRRRPRVASDSTDPSSERDSNHSSAKPVTPLPPSQPILSISNPSVDLIPLPTLAKTKEEILEHLSSPPKMMGWLKKQGHLVQNWKTRYFVLDNGFLTYYLDKSEVPPYGKMMKGQICLAGYRDQREHLKDSSYPTPSENFLERHSSRTTTTAANIVHVDYSQNNMIHLEYFPGLVKEDVCLFLSFFFFYFFNSTVFVSR